METYIYKQKRVKPKELMEYFGLSESTIRRYIDELLQKESIRKEYGYVVANTDNNFKNIQVRLNYESDKKKIISSLAGELIEDGDTIFIDSGTTHMDLIETLYDKKEITLLTNNIMFALKIIPLDLNVEVILIPGKINEDTLSLTGGISLEFLDIYHFDKSFFTASGVCVASGYTNRTLPEAEIKRYIMKRSKKNVVLVDDTKFGLDFPFSFGKLQDFDVMITNEKPPKEYLSVKNKSTCDVIWPSHKDK